jgi:hypothetical protein
LLQRGVRCELTFLPIRTRTIVLEVTKSAKWDREFESGLLQRRVGRTFGS